MKTAPICLFVVAALLAAPAAYAGPKDDLQSQLNQLGAQIETLKAQGASSQLTDLLAEYEALSAELGGDDPAGVLGDRSGAPDSILRAAPADPPGGTTTTANYANNTPTAIPDGPGGSVSVDIIVAGADPFIWDVDLNTDITHTFSSDLDITLTSPGSTTVTITTDNGGGNDNNFSGTLWDDQTGSPATDFTYANLVTATPLIPEAAMGAFNGEDPNGTWTLTVGDDAGLDTGTINSWSLDITTLPAATIDTPNNFTFSPGAAIPDGPGGVLADAQTVSGIDGFLCDVNLTTDITHTFASDLDITLTSPGGITTTITTDNGGGNDDVYSGTLWDDDAPTPATDFVYANLVTATPLVPEGAMAAFIGDDPNGTWTLTVGDDAGLDTGTLNSWQLDIVTCVGEDIQTVAIPTLDVVGLAVMIALLALTAGFVLYRRRRQHV